METLIFAAITIRNGYTTDEMFVPEPAKFKPFDLRALKHLDSAEDNATRRLSDPKKWIIVTLTS